MDTFAIWYQLTIRLMFITYGLLENWSVSWTEFLIAINQLDHLVTWLRCLIKSFEAHVNYHFALNWLLCQWRGRYIQSSQLNFTIKIQFSIQGWQPSRKKSLHNPFWLPYRFINSLHQKSNCISFCFTYFCMTPWVLLWVDTHLEH